MINKSIIKYLILAFFLLIFLYLLPTKNYSVIEMVMIVLLVSVVSILTLIITPIYPIVPMDLKTTEKFSPIVSNEENVNKPMDDIDVPNLYEESPFKDKRTQLNLTEVKKPLNNQFKDDIVLQVRQQIDQQIKNYQKTGFVNQDKLMIKQLEEKVAKYEKEMKELKDELKIEKDPHRRLANQFGINYDDLHRNKDIQRLVIKIAQVNQLIDNTKDEMMGSTRSDRLKEYREKLEALLKIKEEDMKKMSELKNTYVEAFESYNKITRNYDRDDGDMKYNMLPEDMMVPLGAEMDGLSFSMDKDHGMLNTNRWKPPTLFPPICVGNTGEVSPANEEVNKPTRVTDFNKVSKISNIAMNKEFINERVYPQIKGIMN